jgi:biotin-(acetyl-CoA carboxylase) ligase
MSESSTTPNFAEVQRQWLEMAEAAAKPWQEAAKAFAEPWRELAESFGSRTDLPSGGQETWDRMVTSFGVLAEQQQKIAEAVFANLRAAAEEMQKVMEQAVEQMASFQRGATGGGAPTDVPAKKASTRASKASKSASS